MEDILLDENNDLLIKDGDFVVGDSQEQEVAAIIRANQGEYKNDPVIGAGLYRMIQSNATDADVKAKIKLHLERDGKDFEEIKEVIGINVNSST